MTTSITSTAVVYDTLSFTYTDVYTHKPVTLGTKAWNWNGLTTNSSLLFTGIPDWAVKVYVIFDRLSFTAVENMAVQLGDSGGIETAGYTGTYDSWRTTATPAAWRVAAAEMAQLAANEQVSGVLTITRLRAFPLYSMSFSGGSNSVATLHASSGRKELSTDLTQLRVIVYSGGATFNNGTVAVVYQ
jgi:hypothetical protein